MGGKIIPRIRLTSAKDLVEVEAELGNSINKIKIDCVVVNVVIVALLVIGHIIFSCG